MAPVACAGDRRAIPNAVKKHQVRQVIIAMPTARGVDIRDIVRICGEAGVQARIIPGIYELLDGSVSVNQVRDVRIEDLLRREPVRTDVSAVSGMLRGKRVLVSGAGGSIGSELCLPSESAMGAGEIDRVVEVMRGVRRQRLSRDLLPQG